MHRIRVHCRSHCFYKYACLCLTDFDECELELDNCHEDALCINTPTHFECECKDGFLGDGINCTGKETVFRVNVMETHLCKTSLERDP